LSIVAKRMEVVDFLVCPICGGRRNRDGYESQPCSLTCSTSARVILKEHKAATVIDSTEKALRFCAELNQANRLRPAPLSQIDLSWVREPAMV
jgi:hypothetical protein